MTITDIIVKYEGRVHSKTKRIAALREKGDTDAGMLTSMLNAELEEDELILMGLKGYRYIMCRKSRDEVNEVDESK